MEAEQTDAASGALAEQGLSHAHISTQPTAQREAGDTAAFFATFWDGGTAVEVARNVPERVKSAWRAESHSDNKAEAARKRNQVAPGEPQPGEQVGGGKRGRITGFSRQSRRRFLKCLHRLRKDAKYLIVTLTLPDGVAIDGRSLKKWKKAWWQRMVRRFPRVAMTWKIDPQDRKSGAQVGAVVGHYHLLLFNVPMQPGLKEYISESWYEVVGSGDEKHLKAGTRVEVPRDWEAVSRYVSKLYAAHPHESDFEIDDVGRFWGFMGEQFVPWATAIVMALSFREGFRLLRALRAWTKADRRKRGLAPPGRLVQWRAFFVGDASRWLDCAAAL